jgi:hypothetical protein
VCLLFFNLVADQEYPGPAYQGRNDYREIANPGFIPVPQFNPYAMMYQQQPKFSNGWSYFYGYPSLINPEAAPSQRQFDGDDEEFIEEEFDSEIEVGKQAAPAANVCGRGPTTFPTRRSSASERISAGPGATARKGAWPFMVSFIHLNLNRSLQSSITR